MARSNMPFLRLGSVDEAEVAWRAKLIGEAVMDIAMRREPHGNGHTALHRLTDIWCWNIQRGIDGRPELVIQDHTPLSTFQFRIPTGAAGLVLASMMPAYGDAVDAAWGAICAKGGHTDSHGAHHPPLPRKNTW